ncbi:NAD(P)/FAD-dependent oxidoreductase [Leptolyngbyaceae cyanobacterium CCMR0082]|uniref:NAD(P)/FAD-dependent oxidoreductase n=1 Tax=Adonisia turfae CCMR0082 TaxID=2304604 RepID=A0A6M0SBS1_9CYAN|nr:NAD(P)/FAD-dependent oxidoreductase [Adonisia turfae]MDV3352102.1 NAD(P)/FAD-dependent oxidoreductase [Leptothoe sp. LEGE 181152]NEZ65112.1 NAD(P)/FAD-dependent oxidoreductase [Adonisia turfae CCMR0082]
MEPRAVEDSTVPVIVIGGGPAGLTSSYELMKHNVKSIVLEKADKVGGISRTESYKGYRFDIGGHRFFTKVGEVKAIWQEILGDDFIQTPRLSRIYYDGKFYDYPISIFKTLRNLGFIRSFLIVMSYLKAKLKRYLGLSGEPQTFEDWVTDCFGARLYRIFFKTYTEKVWGIPCNQIRADWAAQRIKNLSLKEAVINALFGSKNSKSLIKTFDYPRLGPGMMWERCQEILEDNEIPVHLNTEVVRVEREGNRLTRVLAKQGDRNFELVGDHFVSSMPITALVHRMDPPPPNYVLEAARGLKYRDFLIVSLVIDRVRLFPDNWLYIHSPEFKVGRIQNFKNWSVAMVPDPSKTCLGMEYFCSQGDEIWEMTDSQMIEFASREIAKLNLGVKARDVEDGCVIRQYKAYPVYDGEYRRHLKVLEDYIRGFENLQTVGRNGMHRYNNQDHSMLSALLAARNILGEEHDIWNINVERSYHENFTDQEWSQLKKKSTQPVAELKPLSRAA